MALSGLSWDRQWVGKVLPRSYGRKQNKLPGDLVRGHASTQGSEMDVLKSGRIRLSSSDDDMKE